MQMWHMMTWISNVKNKSAMQKWHFTLAISSFLLWEGSASFGSTYTEWQNAKIFLSLWRFLWGIKRRFPAQALWNIWPDPRSSPSCFKTLQSEMIWGNRCPNHLWLVTRMQTQLPLYYTRTLWPMAMDLEPLILQTPLIPWEVLQR